MYPALLLVTGGAVTESGGGISFAGATPLQLGVLAGSASMNQDNAVGTLAAFTDGAAPSFSFVNDNRSLTIDALGVPEAGVQISQHGFPLAFDLTGSAPDPLSGITTANGSVAVTVAGSGTLTINQPINAGAGSVVAAAVGDLIIASTGSVTGGDITLATLGDFINDAGTGALSAANRWLIYSTNPTADTDGGLTPAFIQYAATYPVGTAGTATAPDASGDGFLFSVAPQVIVNSVTKVYDATTRLPLDSAAYTFNGGFNGDTVALAASGATGVFATANAGTGIGVTLAGLAVNATNSGGIPVFGYTLVAANGGAIGTIAPATLTANLIGEIRKVYDGTTLATLTPANYTLTGILGGDAVSLNNPTLGSFAGANVGTGIGVSFSSLTLTGAAAGNYVLSGNSLSANIGTITPAILTASLIGNVGKVYDGTTAAVLTAANYTLSGVIGGDNVSLNDPTARYLRDGERRRPYRGRAFRAWRWAGQRRAITCWPAIRLAPISGPSPQRP